MGTCCLPTVASDTRLWRQHLFAERSRSVCNCIERRPLRRRLNSSQSRAAGPDIIRHRKNPTNALSLRKVAGNPYEGLFMKIVSACVMCLAVLSTACEQKQPEAVRQTNYQVRFSSTGEGQIGRAHV